MCLNAIILVDVLNVHLKMFSLHPEKCHHLFPNKIEYMKNVPLILTKNHFLRYTKPK